MEVRIFDRDGQQIRTFGGEGESPGEFRRLSWLGRADGDTLVTYDTDLRRATWFTYSGEVVRTLKIEPGEVDRRTRLRSERPWSSRWGSIEGGCSYVPDTCAVAVRASTATRRGPCQPTGREGVSPCRSPSSVVPSVGGFDAVGVGHAGAAAHLMASACTRSMKSAFPAW